MSNNKISSLPSNIGSFKTMKNLSLAKNRISSLPDDMGKMLKLENLNISHNLLQSVPSSFQQLKSLRSERVFRVLNLLSIPIFPVQGNMSVFQPSDQHPSLSSGSEAAKYPGPVGQQDHQDPLGHLQTAGHRACSQP